MNKCEHEWKVYINEGVTYSDEPKYYKHCEQCDERITLTEEEFEAEK